MSGKKSTGYHGSFLDFVGHNPSEPEMKNDVTDDDDNDSQNSGDASSSKHDSASNDSMPILRNARNSAKRGRVMGPKSARKKQAKSDSDGSSTDVPADDDAEPEDDEPPAIPRRIRTTRAAKLKCTQKQLGKRKKGGNGSDDDDTDYSAVGSASGKDDKDDDYFEDDDEKDEKSSCYDSDDDPAWRPKKAKICGGSAKRRGVNRSDSDDDGFRPGRGRGRGARGRGRGQPTVGKSPKQPLVRDVSNSNSNSSSSEKQLPGVVPPPSANATAVNTANNPATAVNAASNPATAVNTVTTTVSTVTTAAVPVAAIYQARPPGRPPTHATMPVPIPVVTSENYVPDLNPPHNCQKGDFILDRRDMNNYTTFPIWRIDSQRLLQKFEAFEKDGKLLHRALCTYSSWPIHAQHNYTAVGVRYVSCTRGKEIVEVHDKYRPRPLGVQGAELDALRESFTIFTQILLSQALEPTFIGALIDEPDPYYSEPLDKVDAILSERLAVVQKLCPWVDKFLVSLKKFHAFTLIDCPDATLWSQATTNCTEQAKKSVRFHGHVYNHETLETSEQVAEDSGPDYALTASESVIVTVLHGLQHLKFKLCMVCQTRVEELKEATPDIDDHTVLDTCLRDQPWMQQMFSRLTSLLENADRVSGR